MKYWTTSLAFLLLVPSTLLADTGFMYKGDLNGDGIEDLIQSGPSQFFGQAGGPCVISVSVAPKKYKKGLVSCSPWGFSLEKSKNKMWPSRYWSYWRHTLGEGSFTATTLDGQFTVQTITLYDTVSDDALGKAINDRTQLIKFEQVDNYVPPEHPCGAPWGKGC